MKEGLLLERKGKLFPYKAYAGAIYGFNNFYGATCRVARGGSEPTKIGENPKEDIIELNIVGLTVIPEDIIRLFNNDVPYLYDKINEQDYARVFDKIKAERHEPDMAGIDPIKKYNSERNVFECVNRIEAIKILCDLAEMPLREPSKKPRMKLEPIIYHEKLSKYFPSRTDDDTKEQST